MRDDLKLLLGSQDGILSRKNKERKIAIRRELNALYERAKENEIDFNTYLVKTIIKKYLYEKKEQIYDLKRGYTIYFYVDKEKLDTYDPFMSICGLILPLTSYEEERISEEDKQAISLLRNNTVSKKNLPSIFTNSDDDEYLILYEDNEQYIPAIYNKKAFKELGFDFKFSSEPYKVMVSQNDWVTVEQFINKALKNDLGNGLVLDDEYVKDLNEKIRELIITMEAISLFRYRSIKNANLVALDVCKKLIEKYKRLDSGFYASKKIHISIPAAYNSAIKEKLTGDELTLLDCFLKQYENKCEPGLVAIKHKGEDNKTRYLPMLECDLKTCLDEILVENNIIYRNKMEFEIDETLLEALINSYREDKIMINKQSKGK